MAVFLVVKELGNGKPVPALLFTGSTIVNTNAEQALTVDVRKRLQQYIVDDTEDGCCRADAQGEGEDSRKRKPTVFENGTNSETQILPEPVHDASAMHAIRRRATAANC
jgi:hypothetical protein